MIGLNRIGPKLSWLELFPYATCLDLITVLVPFMFPWLQIYIGAPNIREYTPGRKSFIDIREFKSPETLAAKIRELDANMDQYMV
jgi:Glycosyltransferase family 10 (fucosyltransferase) C-term